MKLVALITLVLVAAGGVAHATEMVEVANAPPIALYMPPKPTPQERKREQAQFVLVGGVVLLAGGLGLEGAAAAFAVDHPCSLPLSCLFGPSTNDPAVFSGLAVAGFFAVGGGVAMTTIGGVGMRKRRGNQLTLHLTGNAVSLSGRF